MNLKEIAIKRRATKSFLDKKIEKGTLDYILETSNYAPSSIGLESTRFVILRDTKEKYVEEFSFNGEKLKQSSDVVLFVTKTAKGMISSNWARESIMETLTRKISKEMAEKQIDGYLKYLNGNINAQNAHYVSDKEQSLTDWAAKQAYTQMGYMMLAAQEKGVDSLPVEGYSYKKLREKLIKNDVITDEEFVSVTLFLGYRNKKAENNGLFGQKIIRMPISKKVTFK